MGRPKGAQNLFTRDVRDRIEHVFNEINGTNNSALKRLAEEHPAVFYGLVGKLIPQQAAIQVTHTILDLGAAMDDAQQRLSDMRDAHNVIDITPESPENQAQINQPLENKDKSDLT